MSFLKGRFLKRLFAGLLFSIIGYFLLIFSIEDTSFLSYGILSIILCHIFYIRAFYLDFRSAPELDKQGARIAILLTFILSISYYFYIRQSLGKAQLPVLICTLVVAFMMMMASFRNQRVNPKSFYLVLAGILLFALADALFVYVRFLNALPNGKMGLHSLFLLAQILIVAGGLSRKLVRTHSE